MPDFDQIILSLFFLANLVFCAAYVVRHMFWLRFLSICGFLMALPYFIFQDPILYPAVFWHSMFILINLFNIGHLWYEARSVTFNEEEQVVKNLVFQHFSGADFKRLLSIAQWKQARRGETLIHENTHLKSLMLLTSGEISIVKGEQAIARRLSGSFIGELAFLSGDPTSASVVFSSNSRYLHWPADDLNRLMDKHPSLNKAFKALLTIDMVGKLKSNR